MSESRIPPTVKLEITTPRAFADILVADLGDVGFEIFDVEGEVESGFGANPVASVEHATTESDQIVQLNAYTSEPDWNRYGPGVSSYLDSAADVHDWQIRTVESRNWNEAWEATIQPIEVPPFRIRPSWAQQPDDDLIDIVIDPKMSFGTGYHESTRLVLRTMADLVHENTTVLDAGSGTGILAIAAAKLGAPHVVAFDNDPWCAINSAENFERNGVGPQVEWVTGELSDVAAGSFDVVLANINRSVLLDILPDVKGRIAASGAVVLAGLLLSDRDVVRTRINELGLLVVKESHEGEWWSVQLRRAAVE